MERFEKPTLFHIPICPFSQRIEILLELKQCPDAVDFRVVDITVPRPDWLLALSGGRSAMPILALPGGEVIAESLDILQHLDAVVGETPVAACAPPMSLAERDVIALSGPFADAGYALILNRDRAKRMGLVETLLDRYAELDDVLNTYSPIGPFLGRCFGYGEAVFAPLFQRFVFLEYYEQFAIPATSRYSRVARWVSACATYPLARQVSREQIIKLYYDYAMGAPNGALPPGRHRSSFSFLPHWSERPWPPREKYSYAASDGLLGLVCTDVDPAR